MPYLYRVPPVNDRVYIHEIIDIIGHNRANYMQHMTANWSPIGQEERNQLCYGVWALVGSTGAWPKTINMWEHAGWSGLAAAPARPRTPGRYHPAAMVETILGVVQVFICIVLIFLVLMHSGKDAGLSGAFGVGTGAGPFGGGSLVERNLNRWTIGFAIVFVLNTIVLIKIS